MTCPYCLAPRPTSYRPTCGAQKCRDRHRQVREARNQRVRYAILTSAGQCGKCGRPLSTRPSKTTGEPIVSRCAHCLREHNERAQAAADARKAEKARLAAVARLAQAQIERERIQRARLAAGLPISLAPNPRLPKNLPIPTIDL